MLFNSYAFILVFLPAAVLIFHGLRGYGAERGAFAFLAAASLGFYGWWDIRYLALLAVLILTNFIAARWLVQHPAARRPRAKAVLILALAGNLAVLGYFKYANFFVDTADQLLGLNLLLGQIVLPLGISFFTFQKIALLVDAYQGKVRRLDFLDYVLFVTFFPQLIAGPIVHHSELMPQFHERRALDASTIALALTIFVIGLAKKVLLADNLALYATPVFDAASAGVILDAATAWLGALAYTLQLYFDFSGYSEMAIGAALLFGIRLPLNFASPYKAASIIDFWHRWHMTLSRFLRDYLYIPLGGNRRGPARRYVNLFLTMLLGGLWHGAGWTFILWGALHGTYLVLNHLWRALGRRDAAPSAFALAIGRALTFLAVLVGWVLFRADDVSSAFALLRAMTGLDGVAASGVIDHQAAFLLIVPLLLFVWLAPNMPELTGYDPRPGQRSLRTAPARLAWRPSPRWALALGSLLAASLLSLSRVSEFLYFQF
ncbi:MAG TPA: MBOAT family protein [Stellaceae bacterium]|nr:MBOAT family protein [Stellaceae bacterium]